MAPPWLRPDLQEQRDRFHRLAAVAAFVLLERAVRAVVPAALPSPLVGMVGLFGLLLLLNQLGGGGADAIFWTLEPGYRFLLKWAPIFLIPALVRLPLIEDRFDAGVMLRAGVLLCFGGVAQMCFVAAVAERLWRGSGGGTLPVKAQDGAATPPTAADGQASKTEPYPRPYRPYKRRWIKVYAAGMAVAMLSTLAGRAVLASETVFLLCASLLAFVGGNAAPARLRDFVHPLFWGVFGSWLAVSAWAALAGPLVSFMDVLARYSSGPGAGSLLLTLLGPLVIALALLLYERRELLRRDCAPILAAAAAAALSGLFGTAVLARLLGLPEVIGMAAVTRYCTAPLAVAAATSLGASQPLAIAMVVVSGFFCVFVARPLLDLMGVRGSRERGFAIGGVSHVLGTISVASWDKQAVPYSALAFVLVSSMTAALAALPPIQAALQWILT